ncbi:hypothetical protein ACP70R_026883 [Stipagrostis hirtigluma subsp. patula]
MAPDLVPWMTGIAGLLCLLWSGTRELRSELKRIQDLRHRLSSSGAATVEAVGRAAGVPSVLPVEVAFPSLLRCLIGPGPISSSWPRKDGGSSVRDSTSSALASLLLQKTA